MLLTPSPPAAAVAAVGFTEINLARFFFRAAHNAPNLAVNYGAFSMRQHFPRLSIPPSAHLCHRCIFMRPITPFPPSLARTEFSVIRSSLPPRHHYSMAQIEEVDRPADIFIALLSALTLLLLFTAPLLSPSHFATLMSAANDNFGSSRRTKYKIVSAIEISQLSEPKFE